VKQRPILIHHARRQPGPRVAPVTACGLPTTGDVITVGRKSLVTCSPCRRQLVLPGLDPSRRFPR
jgi:hypothetical protein